MTRRQLPNRRAVETLAFSHGGASTQRFIVSLGRFDDGTPAELFLNSDGKAGSDADVNASDGAMAISLALQHGCPLETLRTALKRNVDGSAQGPLGHALDLFAAKKYPERI
jgi:hypothetical protein